MPEKNNKPDFVDWFRSSSPYIHAHRSKTFVVSFGGEALSDTAFDHLIHDIATLNSLGIKLVLVHGARPQIEHRLKSRGKCLYGKHPNGTRLRITDDIALDCVKEAVGSIRVEIEALLSMGLTNTPMAGAQIRVTSGNYVTAQPLGVHEGMDYLHTGEVRRINCTSIKKSLDEGDIVLLSPIGYSPTGEVFNLSSEDVATSAAIALNADKLIFLTENKGVLDNRKKLVQQLNPAEAEKILASKRKLSDEIRNHLYSANNACRSGVRRVHLIHRSIDGALLRELFTRDGIGTLITAEMYEGMRRANIDDVGGILELLKPLEESGALVRRSREYLEMEIDHFTIIERDGMIIGCAALYPYPNKGVGELACLAVHPDYQNTGRGDALLQHIENQARTGNCSSLFVLTTRTAHWFRERGFAKSEIKSLPVKRQELYNYQRKSTIFHKYL